MDSTTAVIALSLGVLALLLTFMCVRGARKYLTSRRWTELAWSTGLAFAAAAMAIEASVYVGYSSSLLFEGYLFASAAIVGVLSLGATKVLHNHRIEIGYAAYTIVACAVVGVVCFLTPLSASNMVTNRIITGDPTTIVIVSSFVTIPATVVLLSASVIALRRSWRWQTLLMIAGALTLGTGGFLYIASFPVLLYYAEFIGIIFLFFGLISLPQAIPDRAAAPTGLVVQ
ncbi:MAG: hypothetical protein L3K03_04380 [Thermoplasmata archaeon]|nr:hypothetical protein [Thermoplasmata archaeon]